MAAIEVLIYSYRGIGRQRILLLLHGNDSMVLLKESVGGTENTTCPIVLALGLK